MDIGFFQALGVFLSFICTFLLSLFHISLSTTSKISVSRFLEEKEKAYRLKVLKIYDEIKIAVEFIRALFLIAFLVYLYITFPRLRFWPLWLFLIILVSYLVFFDLLPRLLVSLHKKKIRSVKSLQSLVTAQ